MDIRAAQFEAQRIGESFDGVLARAVSAAIGQRHVAEHRAHLHDTAFILCAEGWHQKSDQLLPAEDIGFELRPQPGARQVLDRARQPKAAVIHERVQPVVGAPQDVLDRGANRVRAVHVQPQAFEAFGRECRHIRRFARRGEHAPAACPQAAGGGQADAGGTAADKYAARIHDRPSLADGDSASCRFETPAFHV